MGGSLLTEFKGKMPLQWGKYRGAACWGTKKSKRQTRRWGYILWKREKKGDFHNHVISGKTKREAERSCGRFVG